MASRKGKESTQEQQQQQTAPGSEQATRQASGKGGGEQGMRGANGGERRGRQGNGGQRQGNGGQRQADEQKQQMNLARRQQQFMPTMFSPFSLLRRFGEDMEQLFEDFGFGLAPSSFNQMAMWTPQVEVFERDGKLIVRADLPGVNKDDVRVELRDDAIVMRGERREEREENRDGFYRTERVYGAFYREIPLPGGVTVDQAEASFGDGVLEIAIPAQQSESRGRQLQIQDAQSGGRQQPQSRAQAASANR